MASRRCTVLLASALGVTGVSTLACTPAQAATDPVPPFVFTSDRDGDPEIYVRAADGTVTQLTRNEVSDYGAVWSPDGTRLAVYGTGGLWVVLVNGGLEPRRVAEGSFGAIDW